METECKASTAIHDMALAISQAHVHVCVPSAFSQVLPDIFSSSNNSVLNMSVSEVVVTFYSNVCGMKLSLPHLELGSFVLFAFRKKG